MSLAEKILKTLAGNFKRLQFSADILNKIWSEYIYGKNQQPLFDEFEKKATNYVSKSVYEYYSNAMVHHNSLS